MKQMIRTAVIALTTLQCSVLRAAEENSPPSAADAKALFEQRILPIFKSADPSSCVQCHLAGVDLKHYIRPTHEETFLSLRDQGLVDFDDPSKSKILTLIRMGEKEDAGAALIHQKTRRAEYEAFAAWIKSSASDAKLRSAPRLAPKDLAQPERSNEVIRHARIDRLQASFNDSIWALRFRCMSCHTEGTPQNQKLVEEHGEQVAWMKAAGPEATLAYLRTTKLIDIEQPEQSLLLLKPLGEVKHGGGKKMLPGDQGYKAYRTFIEDYARVVKNEYRRAEELPESKGEQKKFGSAAWLRLSNTPPEWAGKLLQVDVYAWDKQAGEWEHEPIATSDRGLGERGNIWQHTVTLLATPGSKRATAWQSGKPSLPAGRYLLKVYVDKDDRLASQWSTVMQAADYVGHVEVESDWPEQPGKFTTADVTKIKK